MSRDMAAASELGFPQQGGQDMLPKIRGGLWQQDLPKELQTNWPVKP